MRILVCGGRDYTDKDRIYSWLDLHAMKHGWLTIIEGGARGADRHAQDWAKEHYHGLITMLADWNKYGSAAGPIRNARMLHAKPDLVLAFPSPVRGLVGTGTGDMVQKARDAGVEVKVVGLVAAVELLVGLGLVEDGK